MYNILKRSEKNINTIFLMRIISWLIWDCDYFWFSIAAYCLLISSYFLSSVFADDETKVGNWISSVIPIYFSNYLLIHFLLLVLSVFYFYSWEWDRLSFIFSSFTCKAYAYWLILEFAFYILDFGLIFWSLTRF